MRDLGEEEAAAGRDRRDDERGPELVAPEEPPDRLERAAHPGEGGYPNEDQHGADHLADDAEHGERHDRVVPHGPSLPQGR